MKKNVFLFLLVAIAVSGLVASYNWNQSYRIRREKIEYMPPIDLLLLDSASKINAQEIGKGKPVVLFYFSPECEHCLDQTKYMLQNIKMAGNAKLVFLTPLPFDELKTFSKALSLERYKNIVVGYDFKYSFYRYFHPESYPYIVIYSRDNELVKLYKGETSMPQIVDAIKG